MLTFENQSCQLTRTGSGPGVCLRDLMIGFDFLGLRSYNRRKSRAFWQIEQCLAGQKSFEVCVHSGEKCRANLIFILFVLICRTGSSQRCLSQGVIPSHRVREGQGIWPSRLPRIRGRGAFHHPPPTPDLPHADSHYFVNDRGVHLPFGRLVPLHCTTALDGSLFKDSEYVILSIFCLKRINAQILAVHIFP